MKLKHRCKFRDRKPLTAAEKKRGVTRSRGTFMGKKVAYVERRIRPGQACPGCGIICEETETIP